MRRGGSLLAWYRMTGTRTPDELVGHARTHLLKLQDAEDLISYVLQIHAGCPDGELEDELRVARMTVVESMGVFRALMDRAVEGDHEVA